tara:strand:+ start:194 stop:424 length:231 start_codon:yes stop_codon:yes gene_type:complete
MKKKVTFNKLNLSKETVSVLGIDSLKNVKGGRTIDEDVMLDIDPCTCNRCYECTGTWGGGAGGSWLTNPSIANSLY